LVLSGAIFSLRHNLHVGTSLLDQAKLPEGDIARNKQDSESSNPFPNQQL